MHVCICQWRVTNCSVDTKGRNFITQAGPVHIYIYIYCPVLRGDFCNGDWMKQYKCRNEEFAALQETISNTISSASLPRKFIWSGYVLSGPCSHGVYQRAIRGLALWTAGGSCTRGGGFQEYCNTRGESSDHLSILIDKGFHVCEMNHSYLRLMKRARYRRPASAGCGIESMYGHWKYIGYILGSEERKVAWICD